MTHSSQVTYCVFITLFIVIVIQSVSISMKVDWDYSPPSYASSHQ
jgi:hypothetical protein